MFRTRLRIELAQKGDSFVEVMFRHCAGVVVRRTEVTATVSHHPAEATETRMSTRTFGVLTGELAVLRKWLLAEKVTHVALRATGSYWKPAFNMLEDTFITWVINPVLIMSFPGRGTDIEDSSWLAALLQRGKLRPSRIPKSVQRELRDLVYYRKSLIDERARLTVRIRRALESVNTKLGRVSSDGLGVAWRDLLASFSEETGPRHPAQAAGPDVRALLEARASASTRVITDSWCRLLGKQLEHLVYLDREIEALDNEVAAQTRPFGESRKLL
ncbi:MAG TPA: transposase [Spirochaetia bacterium]|nr:transposase [Spirochaetia bacterium]